MARLILWRSNITMRNCRVLRRDEIEISSNCYLGGFLREYLFAFILVSIAAVKAYNAAKKRNAK